MMTIGTTVKAAASGMLPAVPCCESTAWPINSRDVPTIGGMMWSPSVRDVWAGGGELEAGELRRL